MEKKEKRVKLNIVDIIILAVALAAIVGVALKLTGHLGGEKQKVGTDITYTVSVENIDKAVYENAKRYVDAAKAAGKPGDELMANGEVLSFYVTDVTAVERENSFNLSTDGTTYMTILPVQREKVDVLFTIQGHTADNTLTTVGTQEVRVGKGHIVKTTHFELYNGIIQDCQWADGTSVDQAG